MKEMEVDRIKRQYRAIVKIEEYNKYVKGLKSGNSCGFCIGYGLPGGIPLGHKGMLDLADYFKSQIKENEDILKEL